MRTWTAWTLVALLCAPALAQHPHENESICVDNGILRLIVAPDGTLTVDRRRGEEYQRALSGRHTFSPGVPKETGPELRVTESGKDKAVDVIWREQKALLRVRYVLPDGEDCFTCEAWVQAGDEALRRDRIVVLDGQLDLGAGQVRSLTHDERWVATVDVLGEKTRSSQFFAAALNRRQTRGIVAGALTGKAESRVDLRHEGGKVSLVLKTQYGGPGSGALILAPGENASSGPFAVFVPENILEGLEAYGAAVKHTNAIKPYEPIPCGWCSWDAFGWIMHEKDIYATLDLIEKHRLVEYGFNTFQIDDGWQCGWRCSLYTAASP